MPDAANPSPPRGSLVVIDSVVSRDNLALLGQFFANLSDTANNAYVVRLKDASVAFSQLEEAVRDHTDLPLVALREEQLWQPGRIYVVPFGYALRHAQGRIQAVPRDSESAASIVVLESPEEPQESALARKVRDLETLVHGSRIPTVSLDAAGRVVNFTPAIGKVYDLRPGDVGRPLSEIAHRAVEMPPLGDVVSPPVHFPGAMAEHEVKTLDDRWYLRRVLAGQVEGQPGGTIITFFDISEQKRATQRLETLQEVTRMLADADTWEEIFPGVLQILCRGLDAAYCALWTSDTENTRLRFSEVAVAEELPELQEFVQRSREQMFRWHEGLPGRVAASREAHWVDDVRTDANFPRGATAAAVGLASGVALPIVTGKRLWGVVELLTVRRLKRDPATLGMLQAISSDIGQFIRQSRLDEQLRNQQSRRNAILSTALDCIITLNMRGRIVDFNPAAEQTFGYRAADVRGKPLSEVIIPPEMRDAHRNGFRRFLESGEPRVLGKRVELTGMRADGSRFPIEVSIQSTITRDGKPFFTGYLRDITDRKRSEEILTQRARLATLHSEMSVSLSGSDPIDETLQKCCQKVVEHLQVTLAQVWLTNDEATALDLQAVAGRTSGGAVPQRRVSLGETKIGQIAATREALWSNQATDEPAIGVPPEGEENSVPVFAGFPLVVADQVVGVVALYARQPLSQEIFEQLLPMADAIAQCVARKRSEEAARQHEWRLAESNNQLVEVLKLSEANQAKLRALFDQSFYFAAVLDLQGNVVDVNQTALVACGYEKHEALGLPFWETPWWSGSEQVRAEIRTMVGKAAAGEAFRQEVAYWISDGTQRICDVSIAPVRDDEGDVIFVLPTGIDVTDRIAATRREKRQARVEHFLSEAGAKLASSLDYEATLTQVTRLCVPPLADWALLDLFDDEGKARRVAVAHANPDDAELARQVQEFSARGDWLDHPPARGLFGAKGFFIPEFTEEMLVRAAQSPEHEQVMRRVGPKSFVVVPLVARQTTFGALTLLSAGSGRRFGEADLILAEELARRAAIAIDNARLYLAAQRANAAKSEFLANMSHEIRTPMTAVLGYTSLLAAGESDPERAEYLQVIDRNGHFLLDIINDILDLSKIEAGKLEIVRQPFSLRQVLADVQSMMSVRAKERGLQFDVEYVGPVPDRIESDAKRLKQILVNLIGNAVKFTEQGSVRLIIRRLGGPRPQIQFDVVDTGIGIPADHLERLFQPFSQGDASVSRSYGGSGLGLAISRRLANTLGGEVTVESQVDQGSTFRFTIDAGEIDDTTEMPVETLHGEAATENADGATNLACRVLVVDDRRDVRFLVRRLLGQAGATIAEAEDGQQALQMVQRQEATDEPFDVVLLDMQMPRLDGYQTATRLRESGYRRPIIALTADAMDADMARCLECGCDSYLSKPIHAESLFRVISASLKGRSADNT